MAFTLRQLQYFVAVAEQGSVSRAAQNLSISQSSVTEAVKELEGDLGVELFERHPRGLTVTHKGHQFLRHATKILADVSDARRTFSGDQERASGSLNLGVTSLVAGYVLSDLLARYRRAFPGVEIGAIEDNGDYLEHLLIGGELDVAVMVISNLRDRMALQAEILEVSPYRLWLPLGHPLNGADIIGINDIVAEPLIMLTVDEIEENTGKLLAALGARPHVAFRTRSVEAVRSLVATGAGIALLARSRLPAMVARRRPHRIARHIGRVACRAGRHGVAARLQPVAIGARFHRHRARSTDDSESGMRSPVVSEIPIAVVLTNEFANARYSRHVSFSGMTSPLESDALEWETLIMKAFLKSCTALAVALSFSGQAMAQLKEIGAGEGQLTIVAWPGYIERGETDKNFDWVTKFEEATGCKVNVKTANTSDEMVALMNEGGFDLVTASGDASLRLVAGKRVQPINIRPDQELVDARRSPQGCALAHGRRRALRRALYVGAERADVQHQCLQGAAEELERRLRGDGPAGRQVEQGPRPGI